MANKKVKEVEVSESRTNGKQKCISNQKKVKNGSFKRQSRKKNRLRTRSH